MRGFTFAAAFIFIVTTNAQERCDTIRYSRNYAIKLPDEQPDLLISQAANTNCSICRLSSNASFINACNVRGIDYDTRSNTIYQSGPTRIKKRTIGDDESQVLLDLEESLIHLYGDIQDIALDWVAQNLYVLQKHALGVIPTSESSSTVYYLLSSRGRKWTFDNAQLVARPNDGYLFVATNDSILRLTSDGSNVTRVTDGGRKPFTIDDYGTVYYTSRNGSVESMDMYGANVKALDIIDVNAMVVDESYLYYLTRTKNKSDLVLRVDKFDGSLDHGFAVYGSGITNLVGLRRRQELRRDNPCNFEKGNCKDGACFMLPKIGTMVLYCKGFKMFH